jgi:hypothetical protein
MSKKKTHSVSEVAALEEQSFIEGMSEGSAVVDDTLRDMMKSIDMVMGMYMREDLGRYEDRVKELHLMYMSLQAFSEMYEGRYFDKLDYVRRSFKAKGAETDNSDDLGLSL